MNIHVLFKVDTLTDPITVKVAKNLSIEVYQKHIGMISDTLVSTLHKPVNVNYSSDNLTCTIELTESISFNKYKVLSYYLKRVDVLSSIKLAFNATDAFSYNSKCSSYVFQDDEDYITVIVQGYQLRNIVKALNFGKDRVATAIPVGKGKALWLSVIELLGIYHDLCKDLID